jgi:23S rRNA G2445 N2-methylase RlmL
VAHQYAGIAKILDAVQHGIADFVILEKKKGSSFLLFNPPYGKRIKSGDQDLIWRSKFNPLRGCHFLMVHLSPSFARGHEHLIPSEFLAKVNTISQIPQSRPSIQTNT